jgi:transcriptional regulator with XRE-family HTH domain
LVKELPLPQLAALTKLSKSYVSRVKNGKKPASAKLLQAVAAILPAALEIVNHKW